MKFMKTQLLITTALLCAFTGIAQADDTDIYSNGGVTLPPGSEPLVMFTLDYRSNLGSTVCNGGECDNLVAEGYMTAAGSYNYFDLLVGTLKKVFDPIEGVKVGLMLNHDNRSGCVGPTAVGCSNGGYIAMGFELVSDSGGDDPNHNLPFGSVYTITNPDGSTTTKLAGSNGLETDAAKIKFLDILSAMPTPGGSTSHSYQGKELFFELYRYLVGGETFNMANGWTDYGTSNADNLNVDGAAYSWDASITTKAGKEYLSPLSLATECTSIYTVNPLFFVANQEDDSDSVIADTIANGGLNASLADFRGMIEYLYDADIGSTEYLGKDVPGIQNIKSFFIVDPTKINNTTVAYAQAGGTSQPYAFSENPDDLYNAISEIFKSILSVSTTFVAASVPVNAFNRAEVVDNVYIALFQANADDKPRWTGNVKKLRLVGLDDGTNNPYLVDANDDLAVAADGRIAYSAQTFWTNPNDLPAPDTDNGEVAGADGRSVARGGAGQKIPGFVGGHPQLANTASGRRVFYDATSSSLAALDVSGAVVADIQADLGVATVGEAAALALFIRGYDLDDEDTDAITTEYRDWNFADALHSRPLPINYGARGSYTETNPAIFIAVSSNDGFMHFIQNTTAAGAESGAEVWSFMPRAAMGVQEDLRANVIGVDHIYTVDGAPVSYLDDTDNDGTIETGEDAWIFFGMRRGGRNYYGLDVTDPVTPDLMWTIEPTGDFAELGYTFSTPRVGMLDWGSGEKPVLIFAGGYDFNKDDRSTIGTNDTIGNSLFVVDAETGALVWKAVQGTSAPAAGRFEHPDLVDSIPSPVGAFDSDGDQLTDRVVVGDSSGTVWRADFVGTDTADWKLTKAATLGRHAGSATKANDRRFFHRPDIVQTKDGTGNYDAIIIGSGDRADPLDKGGVTDNFMYMIKDRSTAVGGASDSTLTQSDLGDVTSNCLQDTTPCTLDISKGWRLQLEDTGEKSLATPITLGGAVFFTTYVPNDTIVGTSCEPSEGTGYIYAVNLQNAFAVRNYDATDDTVTGEPSTKSDRRERLSSPGIPSEIVSLPPDKILRPDLQIEDLTISTRWRTFWYVDEGSDL